MEGIESYDDLQVGYDVLRSGDKEKIIDYYNTRYNNSLSQTPNDNFIKKALRTIGGTVPMMGKVGFLFVQLINVGFFVVLDKNMLVTNIFFFTFRLNGKSLEVVPQTFSTFNPSCFFGCKNGIGISDNGRYISVDAVVRLRL